MATDTKKAGTKVKKTATHDSKKATVKSATKASASKDQAKVKAQSEARKESVVVPEKRAGLYSDDVTINEG